MITDEQFAMFAKMVRPGEYWGQLLEFPDYIIGAHGAVVSFRMATPRRLSPIKMGLYRGFQLKDRDDVLKRRYVHRLVAELIHGPCPDGQECRHLDGDRQNNDYSNLRWGTHTENERDKTSRFIPSKLTYADALEMRRIRADTGDTYAGIAKRFGVTTMTAFRAITGQSWSPEKYNA
jgi:hypothetical protein